MTDYKSIVSKNIGSQVRNHLESLRKELTGHFHGWGINPADMRDVQELLDAIADYAQNSEVELLDEARWRRYLSEVRECQDKQRVREATADPAYHRAFSKFMHKTLTRKRAARRRSQ